MRNSQSGKVAYKMQAIIDDNLQELEKLMQEVKGATDILEEKLKQIRDFNIKIEILMGKCELSEDNKNAK